MSKIEHLNAGSLDKRVSIMETSMPPDGAGGYIESFSLVKKVWARISPIYGKEFWEAKQTQGEVSHSITIRFTTDIKKEHIITHGNRVFDIQYIINVHEESKFLSLRVLERQ